MLRAKKDVVIVATVFVAVVLLVALPVYLEHRRKQASVDALSDTQRRINQMSHALLMYAEDNDLRFPSAETWQFAIRSYGVPPDLAIKPQSDGRTRAIVYNREIAGKKLEDIGDPVDAILLFESDSSSSNG